VNLREYVSTLDACEVNQACDTGTWNVSIDPDTGEVVISERVRGDSQILVACRFDEDGDLEYGFANGEETRDEFELMEELQEFVMVLVADGVLSDVD
tara:strand:+ start:1300 stop:1590 length:291 start_codon:yes stop_codon:yes gene_type:complete